MSSDIKPGQVRRWNNVPDKSIVIDSVDGVKVRYHQEDGASFTTNAIHLGYSTTLYGWDVTPADDATPAPLDPSKVRAGDTVTLESGTALVRDVVIEAKSRGVGQFVFYTAESPDPLIPGTYYLVNHGAWTLTEHQPAPEPEPVWKPGTTGTATITLEVPELVDQSVPGTWVRDSGTRGLAFVTHRPVDGSNMFRYEVVTDFVAEAPAEKHRAGQGNWCVPCETLAEDCTELPTYEALADAMHDDHLPDGEPRLGLRDRQALASAVRRFLATGRAS